MGHIITKYIDTNGEHKKLADELGIEFESGQQYIIQILGECHFQENAEKPTQDGFYRFNRSEFGFTPREGEFLWVKTEGAKFTIAK